MNNIMMILYSNSAPMVIKVDVLQMMVTMILEEICGNDADIPVHQRIDFIFEFVGDDIETSSRDGNNRLEKQSILATKNVQTDGNDGSGTNEF